MREYGKMKENLFRKENGVYPEAFLRRMKTLLGGEYDDFLNSTEEAPVRALRINPFKLPSGVPTDAMCEALSLRPVPYAENGYFFASEKIGSTPWHHAGAFYVQDPGAMSAIAGVNIPSGAKILDLCAAPGGKSHQAIARAGREGFLLANEYVPARAKVTVGNFERLGIPNAMVTSLDTSVFPTLFDSYFDLVICDAPCSGEGMFRKNELAADEWSEGAVLASAKRQSQILNNAAPLVAEGGILLYSTCTYSVEENEGVIDAFLTAHPDYRLIPARDGVRAVTADGVVPPGATCENLTDCRRFYPHRSHGEGQFFAVLRRVSGAKTPSILYKDASLPLSQEESAVLADFIENTTEELPPLVFRKHGENIVALSSAMPVPKASVFSAGVCVGRAEKGRLVPHHQFFSAYGAFFRRKVDLPTGDPRLAAYLHGEEIFSEGENGYVAVLCDGIPLGGGKRVGERVRNYYPKGLRI